MIFGIRRQPPRQQCTEGRADAGIGGKHLMQGTTHQPAARQMSVDFGHAKRQHRPGRLNQRSAKPFEPADSRL